LNRKVELSTEEIDYVQGLLKERIGHLRKDAANQSSKQEKSLITTLQKKLRESAE
jgi:hypothetical protein